MKRLEKEAAMETENLWVARKILEEPERYKDESLMRTWALMIVDAAKEK